MWDLSGSGIKPCIGRWILYGWAISSVQFSLVQSLSHVRLFVTPWIAARQASLSITNSRSSLRFTSIESVMPSSHLILCCPLPLLPPIPPSIRVFSNESTHCMRWPKYYSFSFSISPSKEHPGERGVHIHPWLIHVNVWQNQYSIVKQNKVKIKIKKKKKMSWNNLSWLNWKQKRIHKDTWIRIISNKKFESHLKYSLMEGLNILWNGM